MSSDHKLAAILFADISGYTAMMQKNEQNALELLNRFKDVLELITPKYHGWIVQYFGDGCLLAFDSSTSSVDCAIALQKAFSETPSVPVRIGMHQGDVIFKNGNVFGDGVNIASRIESLGIPGAILMSKTIRDQVKNQKEFLLVSLGSFDFKNVEEKMEVFALANPGFVVPKPGEMHGKLKDIPKKASILKWITAIVLIAVSAIVLWLFIEQKRSAETVSEKSIAVLPFADMSAAKDQEYFSDGLSDELSHLLAIIPELKVIPSTSSFAFKNKKEDPRIIGKKLDVNHLLKGSVRKDGDTIRVTAQLINAADGSILWGDKYDSDFKNILKLQDEIAGAVVKELKLRLIPIIGKDTETVNTEVYNLILQGNYFLEKRNEANLELALTYYQRALVIDSLSARCWAGIARCYNLQTQYSSLDPVQQVEAWKQARLAANRAILLDKKQTEALAVLAAAQSFIDFDWEGTEVTLQKALKLEPQNPDLLMRMGLLYTRTGRYDEAIKFFKRSITLNPIKSTPYVDLGWTLYLDNQLEEAIASFKKGLELNPDQLYAHHLRARIYLLQKKPELALKEMNHETDEGFKIFGLGLIYHSLDRKKDADDMLNDLLLRFQTKLPYQIAALYAFRGENEKAFEWLDKAYSLKDWWLSAWIKGDPLLKKLWEDPRYHALLEKMNLPLN